MSQQEKIWWSFFFLLWPAVLFSGQGKDNHTVVLNDGVEEAYARAIENLVETAWEGYVKDLQLPLPDLITVHLGLNPGNKLRLYNDGASHIYLQLSSMDQLRPSTQSGVFNIYGFCHELGHIAMYHRLKTVAGINSGVAEGWAHFCGSIICDFVYKKRGKELWPVPYDYNQVEGIGRLRRQVKEASPGSSDHDLAVKGFWDLYLALGKKKFFRAVDLCLKERPSGDAFLPLFLKEVRKVSGRSRLPEFFPEKLWKKEFRWDPAPPDLKSKATFKDLRITRVDRSSYLLHYNAEPPDPSVYRSIASTGYFQLYRLPWTGKGALIGFDIFGGRYGGTQHGDEDVLVWICDANMNVLHEHTFKYGKLNWGRQAKWFSIPDWSPVQVPPFFLVGISFNATATKGYFTGYQEKVSGHSYSGSTAGLSLLKGNDGKPQEWMMRVKVTRRMR